MNAIDTWIAAQPGFQPTSGKLFRSPYNEFAYTVDLTWAQYERNRSSNTKSRIESRAGLTMKKKERLDPVRYDDNDVVVMLSWDDLEMNSILRAEVPPLPSRHSISFNQLYSLQLFILIALG